MKGFTLAILLTCLCEKRAGKWVVVRSAGAKVQ
jgi:hypothetical protein